jgi:dolichyl-phosphooligosaccharide-protein glycotransferase
MSKKELMLSLLIIVLLFSLGFVLRIESTHLTGISLDEKAYYEDQNGLPYMYELDSYYNYRLTKDYIDHGYLGDTIINGKNWDLHSYYPPGISVDYPPLIVYIATLFYKFVNLFIHVPLIVTCFWLPAFVGPLSGVVAYLFVRRFTNNYGAAAAGILTVTVPFYFFRTVPGWFDTDMFNIIFPLLIMWFIAEAVYTENINNRIYLSILAAISLFIFSLAWKGWIYVFYVILISLIFYIPLSKLKKFKTTNIWQVFGLFTGLTILFMFITGTYLESLLALNFTTVSTPRVWPNILVSVSELGKPSIEEVVSDLGFVLFAGILSLLWIFRVMINKKLKERYLKRMTWYTYSLLIIWTIIGFFALTNGSRFVMILLPPLIVSSGIMVGICVGYLGILHENTRFDIFRRRKNIIKILSLCILLLVTVPAVLNVYGDFSCLTPGANDDIWNAAEWINNNTSNDTVIISDWDYGYFFASFADRPVVVDGGMQNSPRTYWIYKAFSTDNETLSLGIFQMLATSGDNGYLALDIYTKNTTKTVEILNNILGVDNGTAMEILMNKYGLDQKSAENVIQYTHPNNPRPFVLLTYGEGAYWIFKFGTWNFNKKEGGNYDYSHGDVEVNKNILNSSNNVTVNLETGNVTWNGQTPYCFINVTNGSIKKHYSDKGSNFCVILLMDTMQAVVIDKQFENSTFTKLWLEKSNSTVFKQVYENENVVLWEPKVNSTQ